MSKYRQWVEGNGIFKMTQILYWANEYIIETFTREKMQENDFGEGVG